MFCPVVKFYVALRIGNKAGGGERLRGLWGSARGYSRDQCQKSSLPCPRTLVEVSTSCVPKFFVKPWDIRVGKRTLHLFLTLTSWSRPFLFLYAGNGAKIG